MTYELHPLCTLFPRMSGAEFDALKYDIAENGLRQPIVIHNGFILDGGNRYRACTEVGVNPDYVDFDGENLVSFVLSANLHRRHMEAGQRAAIVSSATDWAKAQKHGGDRKSEQSAVLHLETVADRAAISGASKRTQKTADKMVRENPKLAKEVTQGHKSLYRAEQESKTIPQLARDESPDIAELAEELQAENEAMQRQIASLQTGDAESELVRMNRNYDALNGRLQGEISAHNEAKKQAQYYSDILTKIRKFLGVEKNSQIIGALKK